MKLATGCVFCVVVVLGAGNSAAANREEKEILSRTDWRVLVLTQAHHRSRLSDSVKNGNALSSVHNAALPLPLPAR